MSGAIKINGTSSGSTTITAPASGGDETIELSTALAAKLDASSYSPSGLVYVTGQTFSAVSSVSLNNCFTSTYETYRVELLFTTTTAQEMIARMRASGTDTTGTGYSSQRIEGSAGTPGAYSAYNTDGFRIGYAAATVDQINRFDIFRPQTAQTTTLAGEALRIASMSALYAQHSFGRLNDTTAYDGITVVAASGTITGSIRIYGYQKA